MYQNGGAKKTLLQEDFADVWAAITRMKVCIAHSDVVVRSRPGVEFSAKFSCSVSRIRSGNFCPRQSISLLPPPSYSNSSYLFTQFAWPPVRPSVSTVSQHHLRWVGDHYLVPRRQHPQFNTPRSSCMNAFQFFLVLAGRHDRRNGCRNGQVASRMKFRAADIQIPLAVLVSPPSLIAKQSPINRAAKKLLTSGTKFLLGSNFSIEEKGTFKMLT